MKNWQFREGPPGAPPKAWAEELSISPLLLEILWRRGFTEARHMEGFLSARLNDLTAPACWPQIPQAAELLAQELGAGKKLAVWGDYDVDGITATCLVLDVLEAHGLTAAWHIPDRRAEGYGLNIQGVEALAAQGCGILLTVDCGISDLEAVRRARDLGMTVIISRSPPSPRATALGPMRSAIPGWARRMTRPVRIWPESAWPFISWLRSTPSSLRRPADVARWTRFWIWWLWAPWPTSCG